MQATGWFLLIGALLLAMGLTFSLIKRLPFTTAIVYLVIGMLIGPMGFNSFHFNPLQQSGLLEIITELAVLISLFSAGMKMPVPVRLIRWRAPVLLAFVSMAITVGFMALFGYFVLGLQLGAAVLLGAILAPTDPVLATDVQVRHPGDTDRLRFGLTCEAGMNDGSAFPFVMLGLGLLGLHELGSGAARWLLVDVLWATVAGIGIGVVCGAALACLCHHLQRSRQRHQLLDDFLGLGLIGLVYGLSLMLNAWGFLSVFFAAVALRQTELKLSANNRARLPFDEAAAGEPNTQIQTVEKLPITDSILSFKEPLERLSELVLILIIGGTLFFDSWSLRAVATAAFLFVVARPASVLLGMLGSRKPWKMRWMTGWFGVRGIGSLYYLMYAVEHGLPEELALELIHLTLIVVTLSILVHGVSVKPFMRRFWRAEPEMGR